jgi:nitrate reductase assembly molybdenum cofactor insertion protein NarJ
MTLPDASLSLRALARLLSYPDETLAQRMLPEIREALKSDEDAWPAEPPRRA